MTRMFAFDPDPYASTYAQQGYVHLAHGLTEEYHRLLGQQVEEHLRGDLLHNFALGNKQQALYPLSDDYLHQLVTFVARVCGLDAERLLVSERHIKSYEPDANPNPLAHKDRFGSEVSVGFAVRVPAGSTLILYPHDDVSANPFNSSAELRNSLRPHQLPEETLRGAKRLEIADGPGDVVLFRGSAFWHMRLKPAGTIMVYFKMNTFNSDPLGEDPRSPAFRQRSQALADGADDQLEALRPLLGRSVDSVQRRFNHQGQEVAGVVLGQRFLTVDEHEYQALQALVEGGTVRDVVQAMGNALSWKARLNKVRFLVARGAIDLLPAKPETNGVHPQQELATVVS